MRQKEKKNVGGREGQKKKQETIVVPKASPKMRS
jgi:hypothetical protein